MTTRFQFGGAIALVAFFALSTGCGDGECERAMPAFNEMHAAIDGDLEGIVAPADRVIALGELESFDLNLVRQQTVRLREMVLRSTEPASDREDRDAAVQGLMHQIEVWKSSYRTAQTICD